MIIDIIKKNDGFPDLMMDTLSESSKRDGQAFLGMRTCMEEWQNILDAFTDIITIHDRDFNILMANKAFYEKFNISKEELSAKKCYEIFHNSDSCMHNCQLSRSCVGSLPVSIEVCGPNKGEKFLVSIFPIKDQRGQVYKYIHQYRDITLDKKYEKHLLDNSCKLEKLYHELEEFTYIISHNLKEPLYLIESYMELLLKNFKNTFDEKGKLYVNRAKANINIMSRKIHETMEVLRPGGAIYCLRNNDSGEIVKGVIEECEDKIKTDNIKIVIQDNLPIILCDKQRLKDLFLNLINNAIKYMGNDTLPFSKSGDGKCIKIGYDTLGNYYKFFVKDNGIGIKADYHEQIFEMFRRLNDIQTEGMGVGLAIAQNIVEQHNGSIWVESPVNDGKGAIFNFTIPVIVNKESLRNKT